MAFAPAQRRVFRPPTYLDAQRIDRVNSELANLDAVLCQCGNSPEMKNIRAYIRGAVDKILALMLTERV